jgi:hypothetical protein
LISSWAKIPRPSFSPPRLAGRFGDKNPEDDEGVAGGIEAEVTREDGERSERRPEERDADRLWDDLRCGICCRCRDDVISMLPPPTAGRLLRLERTLSNVLSCACVGKIPDGGVMTTVPVSCAYE